jgi:hypothetical protein
MKFYLLLMVMCVGTSRLFTQDTHPKGIVTTAGASALIYQSGFSFENSMGIELTVANPLAKRFGWQVGIRSGFNMSHYEGFGRLLMSEQRRSWFPTVGIEAGYTGRAHFGEGEKLLRETRQAMLNDVGKFYIAAHAAPLKFTFHEHWMFSVLELNIGTHLKNMGRTLRVELGIVHIGRRF